MSSPFYPFCLNKSFFFSKGLLCQMTRFGSFSVVRERNIIFHTNERRREKSLQDCTDLFSQYFATFHSNSCVDIPKDNL